MRKYATPAGNTKPRPFSINEAEFHSKPVMTADQLSEMFLLMTGNADNEITYDPEGDGHDLRDYFRLVMEPASFDAFDAFVLDKNNIVRIDLLYKIAQDLFEDYAGVPFAERVALLSSRLKGLTKSEDDSSSTESTPAQ